MTNNRLQDFSCCFRGSVGRVHRLQFSIGADDAIARATSSSAPVVQRPSIRLSVLSPTLRFVPRGARIEIVSGPER